MQSSTQLLLYLVKRFTLGENMSSRNALVQIRSHTVPGNPLLPHRNTAAVSKGSQSLWRCGGTEILGRGHMWEGDGEEKWESQGAPR